MPVLDITLAVITLGLLGYGSGGMLLGRQRFWAHERHKRDLKRYQLNSMYVRATRTIPPFHTPYQTT